MPRRAREESGSELYHVTQRGAGHRSIFEDDDDRRRFVDALRSMSEKDRIALLAWCLMDNHVHILAKAPLPDLSKGIHRLMTSYAHYFNGKHGHIGPVFQDRFESIPVETDAHLLASVRYIHLNPRDSGFPHPADCPWSSYQEYVGKAQICETSIVLDLIGGKDAFVAFSDPSAGHDYLVNLGARGPRLSEAEARRIAISCFGADFADCLATLDKSERDRALRRLKASGLSIRQIERLTGIGRNVIARA